MTFCHHVLENGLEIVAELRPQAYSCAIAFFVRAGARDETPEVSGVSHFLEHMVFKGSTRRSAEQVNRELDELSVGSNAFTSEEQTVYFATTLPEDQGALVELLADMLRPALRPDDFETEKQVILEEIAKYDDQPPYGAHEKCLAAFFGEHPLGHSILGTTASISALSRQQMLDYFEQRYSPSNIVLAAAGRVDFEELVKQAAKYCGPWPRREAPRRYPQARPRAGFQVLHKPQAVQEYVVQLAPGPSARDDDRYPARLLAAIVGDDMGSRMFWELVDTGRAETATLGTQEFEDAGAFCTWMACLPDLAADNLKRIREILQQVRSEGVTEEELARAKSKVCAHLVLHAERSANRLFAVGSSWLIRRDYRTVREAVQRYQTVTLEDIQRVLARFDLVHAATVAVGPLATLDAPW
jgi:predicted Zn-dependent peptidase